MFVLYDFTAADSDILRFRGKILGLFLVKYSDALLIWTKFVTFNVEPNVLVGVVVFSSASPIVIVWNSCKVKIYARYVAMNATHTISGTEGI